MHISFFCCTFAVRNPIRRIFFLIRGPRKARFLGRARAALAELVDAPDLGSGSHECRFESYMPHFMKKITYCLVCLVLVGLASCGSNQQDYTPYVTTSSFYLNPIYSGDTIIAAQDTLSLHIQDDHYVLDTISVTDTLVFMVGFGSYANNLTATLITFDTTQLNMSSKIPEEVRKILLPTSDIRNLQLYLNSGYNFLALPMGYRPLKSGTHRVTFTVESDSEFSPRSLVIDQPVR